jgi:hypothetical protein
MTPRNSIPLIKQGWLRAILLLLAFFACALLAGLIGSAFLPASGGKTGTPPNAVIQNIIILTIFITTIFSIALTVIFRRFIDRKPVKSLGFNWRPYQPDAFTGFCLGIALLGIATLLLYAKNNLDWTDVHFKASDFFIALVLMLLVAFAEEMVFRGYILNNLMQSMNKWLALGISAGLFTIAHISNPGITSVAIANILLAGLLLGINFIYTRNIWFAIFFHFTWNFFQGPVFGYDVSGLALQSILEPSLQGPWWLTGGTFGIEGSFVTTGLFTGSLLILYYVYQNKYNESLKTSQ